MSHLGRFLPKTRIQGRFKLLFPAGVALTCSLPFVLGCIYLDSAETKRQETNNNSSTAYSYQSGLRISERTYTPNPGTGISRYDVAQVNSGYQTPGAIRESTLPVPSGFWSIFSISQGISDGAASSWVQGNLIPAVAGALADLYSKFHTQVSANFGLTPSPKDEEVQDALIDTFLRLEDDLSRYNPVSPTLLGIRSLVTFYDSHHHRLHVARSISSFEAVVGRHTGSQLTYTPITLLHKSGSYPASLDGDLLPPSSYATSYATSSGDFLILGNDTFWNRVTGEEAVKLVSQWQQVHTSTDPHLTAKSLGDFFSVHLRDLFDYRISPSQTHNNNLNNNVARQLVDHAMKLGRSEKGVSLETANPNDQDTLSNIIAAVVFFAGESKCNSS